MFDKQAYRNRRDKGLRGQGDKIRPKVEPGEGGHMIRTSKGFKMVNRKQARQKLRSRYYENEEDKVGRPFTRKGVKHQQGESKFKGPLHDPSVSNHERVRSQRIRSGRIKLDQGD